MLQFTNMIEAVYLYLNNFLLNLSTIVTVKSFWGDHALQKFDLV